MPVSFTFGYDDVYFDPCKRGLIFIYQGREVMSSTNMSFDGAMKILKESRVRIAIDRLETVKKITNEISEVLDEVLKLREEGGKNLVDLKYQLRKLDKLIEDFERDGTTLMKEGRRLASESA